MGLDMYLNGTVYFYGLSEAELKSLPVSHTHRLGYWRKHPDLHGCIVEHFAGGTDDCREINLSVCDMLQIIEATAGNRLPRTTGFFFGESRNDSEQNAETVAIFRKAIAWCRDQQEAELRHVSYRASW
jgi:hypothetical protein